MSDTLVVLGLLLQVLTFATLAVFLFHLLRSQGRLLLRLDSLERGATNLVNISNIEPAGPVGLKLGTPIEDFLLPDLTGKIVSLSDFRGKRVLLLYWSPDRGFCEMTAEELAPMADKLKKANIQPVLVAYSSAEANRKLAEEQQLGWPILLMKDAPAETLMTETVFQFCGTPAAYMLDTEGKVEHRLVVGSDDIVKMVSATVQSAGVVKDLSLAKSRIERSGIKAGTVAPSFALPDLNGENVTLEKFRGRKVLLVFSDPHCEPCDALAPELVKLHRKHRNNGMAVVMVGRGDVEENRKKALEHKMEFSVVLQEKWKLSRKYGIFATPAAFLIGNDGVIVKDVAQGAHDIMKLAHEGLASN